MRSLKSITTTAEDIRDFECAECGHRARARVTGLGTGASGSWQASAMHAEQEAWSDIETTRRLVHCPKCGRRGRGEAIRFWSRHAPLAAVVMGLGLAFGAAPFVMAGELRADLFPLAIGFPTFAAVLLIQALARTELRRWKSVDRRVTWLSSDS